jgi:hypothetical protein
MSAPDDVTPILVYQMGKVGSRSVFETLAGLRLPRSIYHFHVFNGLAAIERSLCAEPSPSPRALEHVRSARRVRRLFVDQTPKHWDVISLVRDPVARNLSSFFYNIRDYVPGFEPESKYRVEALLETFLERFDHSATLTWFEDQFVDPFGIDVFDAPFAAQRGFELREYARVKLLLMRAEDLDAHLATALASLLQLERVEPRCVNRSSEKPYGQVYRDFLARAALPTRYLDWLYRSRLARHFYSAAELERFHARWRRPATR